MPLDLFQPIVPEAALHPNFVRIAAEEDDAIRVVLQEWAEGFVDRDKKFVQEFQRTFNSSWWELYLYAVLKSRGIPIDFSFNAPDFVTAEGGFAIEATIASHAAGATPEWLKTMDDLSGSDDINERYLEAMARLSNSISSKLRKYREDYCELPHMADKGFVIAIQNFGTPDFHQLGDVAMQRLLYDVWEEKTFLKGSGVQLSTGLFLDSGMSEVSAVIYSSLATMGKARALSGSKGHFFFEAVRILGNEELIHIRAFKDDYRESLCDGLRVFHNPFAVRPLSGDLFFVDDIRQFRIADGVMETTCNPAGDLCMRQVTNFKERRT